MAAQHNYGQLKTGSSGECENRRTELQIAVTGMEHISPNTVGLCKTGGSGNSEMRSL